MKEKMTKLSPNMSDAEIYELVKKTRNNDGAFAILNADGSYTYFDAHCVACPGDIVATVTYEDGQAHIYDETLEGLVEFLWRYTCEVEPIIEFEIDGVAYRVNDAAFHACFDNGNISFDEMMSRLKV